VAPNDPANLFEVMPILAKALTIAELEGAEKISVEHLWDALNADPGQVGFSLETFTPSPKREMAFTAGAQVALEELRRRQHVNLEVLKLVLLDAKRQDLH